MKETNLKWPDNLFSDIGIIVDEDEKEKAKARIEAILSEDSMLLTKREKQLINDVYREGKPIDEIAKESSITKNHTQFYYKRTLRTLSSEYYNKRIRYGRKGEGILSMAEEYKTVYPMANELKDVSLYDFIYGMYCPEINTRARTHLYNILYEGGIWNLYQLSKCTNDAISCLKGYGPVDKKNLTRMLSRFGIVLKDNSDGSADEGVTYSKVIGLKERWKDCLEITKYFESHKIYTYHDFSGIDKGFPGLSQTAKMAMAEIYRYNKQRIISKEASVGGNEEGNDAKTEIIINTKKGKLVARKLSDGPGISIIFMGNGGEEILKTVMAEDGLSGRTELNVYG